MKHSFYYLLIASLCFHISCKTNVEPNILFETAYSIAKDSVTIVDDENALLTVSLDNTDSYKRYTYTLTDDGKTIYTNDTLQLTKEFSLDVKKLAKFKKYSPQDVDINVTLIGDDISKTITRDIDYLFDATSPIPYVVINTKNGDFPVDRTRLDADFKFYETRMKDGWYSINGPYQSASGTIHARGQGSLAFPKKSFSLNFGKENPLSIMGMPESHKWVMIANWVDTSQLCNKVSYDSYAEMGHYGAQSRYVQVFLNGEYWGLYTYGEKIQQGKNHVNTPKKSDGGFIVKEVDNAPDFVTISGRWFQYEYPDNEDATDEQRIHIQETINSYEREVKTGGDWENSVAEAAEIDYFIMTDVFANPDSYFNGKNVFYFLNQEDQLEPVIWDFIWAFGTPYYTCNDNNPWCYIYSPIGAQYCSPECSYWVRNDFSPNSELMYGNPKYKNQLGYNRFLLMEDYMKTAQNVNMFKDRYYDWRNGTNGKKPVLSDANILGRTDKLIAILRSGEIYKKDSIRWSVDPDFNRDRYSPENIRNKIKERLVFMDSVVKNLKVQQ
ncbi:CotH kinase family protein [uncultured Kordia sp.]|uniref:CotH kinase family protein n=1 Tax=uncultured Kordia sp. TaxID=507699 RepID=UPI00262EC768|nr:CotH kinase family protein [uncultured Kordia sp.]